MNEPFALSISGTPGDRRFMSSTAAEIEARKLMTDANKDRTIRIERHDHPWREYRFTMGDDGFEMWHTYNA